MREGKLLGGDWDWLVWLVWLVGRVMVVVDWGPFLYLSLCLDDGT